VARIENHGSGVGGGNGLRSDVLRRGKFFSLKTTLRDKYFFFY
jgi:hypothetical protein